MIADLMHAQRDAQIAAQRNLHARQAQGMAGLGGLGQYLEGGRDLLRSQREANKVQRKPSSIKEELQDEVDEWLKDTI